MLLHQPCTDLPLRAHTTYDLFFHKEARTILLKQIWSHHCPASDPSRTSHCISDTIQTHKSSPVVLFCLVTCLFPLLVMRQAPFSFSKHARVFFLQGLCIFCSSHLVCPCSLLFGYLHSAHSLDLSLKALSLESSSLNSLCW